MYRLIACDLDETLLDKGRHVSKRAQETIKMAEAQGLVFAPATGRGFYSIKQTLEELDAADKAKHYMIGFNGGVVVENQGPTIIKDFPMDYEILARLFEFASNYEVAIHLYTFEQTYVYHSNPDEDAYLTTIPHEKRLDDDISFLKDQARICATLEHHLGDGWIGREHLLGVLITKQCALVIFGEQGDIHFGQHRVIRHAGRFHAGPQARAIVVVEHHPATTAAGFDQGLQQAPAADLTEHSQGDAAEIHHVVARQRRQNGLGGGRSEAVTHGGFVAPIQKFALASGVGLDAIQARQTPRQALHQAQAETFVGPLLAHRIAEAVIAQGGDVVDAATSAQLTAQVHRGVQGIAAEALVQAAVGAVLQFDHAFADQGDARGCVHA